MPSKLKSSRGNQRRRTRKDLLAAAARLLKAGRTPGMDDVADEAMVSRATAYRYFPTIESLLVEAPLDGAVPDPQEIFANDQSRDPILRVEKAEAAMHDMTYRNQSQLRLMLIASLERAAQGLKNDKIPIRQNRRSELIEAALAPARDRFSDAAYKNLASALALIFGLESMIVFTDVLGLDARSARKIKSWAVRSLVQSALKESARRS